MQFELDFEYPVHQAKQDVQQETKAYDPLGMRLWRSREQVNDQPISPSTHKVTGFSSLVDKLSPSLPKKSRCWKGIPSILKQKDEFDSLFKTLLTITKSKGEMLETRKLLQKLVANDKLLLDTLRNIDAHLLQSLLQPRKFATIGRSRLGKTGKTISREEFWGFLQCSWAAVQQRTVSEDTIPVLCEQAQVWASRIFLPGRANPETSLVLKPHRSSLQLERISSTKQSKPKRTKGELQSSSCHLISRPRIANPSNLNLTDQLQVAGEHVIKLQCAVVMLQEKLIETRKQRDDHAKQSAQFEFEAEKAVKGASDMADDFRRELNEFKSKVRKRRKESVDKIHSLQDELQSTKQKCVEILQLVKNELASGAGQHFSTAKGAIADALIKSTVTEDINKDKNVESVQRKRTKQKHNSRERAPTTLPVLINPRTKITKAQPKYDTHLPGHTRASNAKDYKCTSRNISNVQSSQRHKKQNNGVMRRIEREESSIEASLQKLNTKLRLKSRQGWKI